MITYDLSNSNFSCYQNLNFTGINNEVDLMDGYKAESAKADFALHFKPFAHCNDHCHSRH